MKNLVSLGVFLLILLSVQVNAQEQSVLQIRPTGRILMDGGLFHSDNKNFVDGVAIPVLADICICCRASGAYRSACGSR